MSALQSKYCVALSGQKWSVGNFTLWQSSDDRVILFTPKQPTLARNLENKRYQAAVSQFRVQKDGTYKIVGGGALLTVATGIEYDAQTINQLKEQWRQEVVGSGKALSNTPIFMPLVTRKATAELLMPEISGRASQATTDNKEFGAIGSHVSLLANLTPEGAQEWVQGIRERKNIPAGVMIRYEYLQTMPVSELRVKINGQKVFRHLSAHLNASYNGWFYGGSLDIQAQWESMVRTGVIDFEAIGLDALPEGMEQVKQNIMNTFIDQALKNFFPLLFEKKPDAKPAQAGNTAGAFGGTNFALKWRKETDATDLEMNMKFSNFSWLKGAMDADVTTLMAGLDESYVNEVNTEMTFPALVDVGADEMVNSVAVSCTANEGMIPTADVFDSQGGSKQYLITSQRPDNVRINYKAKINFKDPKFPILDKSGSATLASGGNIIPIKPSDFLRRMNILLYVKDSAGELGSFEPNGRDRLILSITVAGPHLKTPIKESIEVKPEMPLMEVVYPVPQDGSSAQLSFTCMGVVGGKPVFGKSQPLVTGEDAFIVVDQKGARAVSSMAELLEDDETAQRLLEAGTTPKVEFKGGVLAIGDVTSDKAVEPASMPNGASNGAQKRTIAGTLMAVEYGKYGPALWVETDGTKQRVRLHEVSEADPFDDEGRKQVRVLMDDSGYAESILVEL